MPHFVKAGQQDEPGIEAVSWDTFPPVPPGAEDWQPDPDTISKPGPFRDIRFRQDAAEYRVERLIETQGRMHKFSQGEVAAIKKAVLPSYKGRIYSSQADHEPVPVPASSSSSLGQPQDRLGTRFQESVGSVYSGLESVDPHRSVTGSQSASTVDVEKLRKSPVEEQNPLALNKFAPSLPSTQANVSAPIRSIPPHLRKKVVPANAAKSSSNEPTKVINKSAPVSNEVGKQMDVASTLTPSRAVPEQDLQPQVGSGGTLDYSRYLKFKIITMMEEDMHLERRLTEKDLRPMSNKDMRDYMLELSKQHEIWWNDKQNGVA